MTGTIRVAIALAALMSAASVLPHAAAADDKKFKVIGVLGPLSDPFFSAMKKGTEAAAAATGVSFEFTAPQGFDNLSQDLSRLIEIGIGRKPDAMVIGDFIPNAENEGIRAAVDAGIRVIIINTGANDWQKLGAITYIGPDEVATGKKAAEIHLAAGSKNGLCVNHVPGNPGTEARCKGFEEAMTAAGKKVTLFNLPYSDAGSPQQVTQAIKGRLASDSSIDSIYTLGAGIAEDALQAVDTGGLGDKVKVGTSDVSVGTLQAVKDGKLLFDIDQQPFLQGYYGVLAAAQYLAYGITPIGAISSGPLVITKDNVDAVLDPKVSPYRGAM